MMATVDRVVAKLARGTGGGQRQARVDRRMAVREPGRALPGLTRADVRLILASRAGDVAPVGRHRPLRLPSSEGVPCNRVTERSVSHHLRLDPAPGQREPFFFSVKGQGMRGIRGAICVDHNARDSIHRATRTLLGELVRRNRLEPKDIVAAFFTMTPDLDADFPAYAARDMGWSAVPMLGAQESQVPGAPPRAIRVLVLAEGEGEVRTAYLGRAAAMRPDLAEPGDELWTEAGPAPSRETSNGKGALLVIGLGLIGGSLAAGARRSGLFTRVLGYDLDASAVGLALERGLVDEVAADLDVVAGRADMIVLATPVSAIVQLLERLGQYLRRGAIVTDVGSTKRRIVEAMGRLPAGVGAVGGHPMAGGTTGGASAANPELFKGARWAVVESARTNAGTLRAVEELVQALGARPVRLEAEQHDRIVALTSHLPAAVSVGLVQTVGAAAVPASDIESLLGPGFLSTSRLADGDPLMTADMLADNADYLGTAIANLVSRLEDLARTATADRGVLSERLARTRAIRRSLLGVTAD